MFFLAGSLNYQNIKRLSIWIVASLFYSFQMGLRVLPAIIAEFLSDKYDMSAADIGLLAGIYYIGYAISQVPLGVILDKYNPRIIIPSLMLLVCGGLLLTIYGSTKNDIYLARLFMGIGAAAGFLGSVRASDDFFPDYYAQFVGMTILLGAIGVYMAGSPLAKFIDKFGVEASLILGIKVLLILAAYILLIYRRPKQSLNAMKKVESLDIIKHCFTNKKLILIAICAGSMIGPFAGFADMWGIRYFVNVKHMSLEAATFCTTLIFLGFGVASPISSYISNLFKSATAFIFTTGILQIICFILLIVIKTKSIFIVAPLCFVVGLLFCWQVAVFALAQEITKLDVASASTSIINMFMTIFSFIYNFATGFILKTFFIPVGYSKLSFDRIAYISAFSFMIICSIAGVIGFVILSKQPGLAKKNI